MALIGILAANRPTATICMSDHQQSRVSKHGSSPALAIEHIGPLASLQDMGRRHAQALGITKSGAADVHAYCWANYLAGNPLGAPALELALGPHTFLCLSDIRIAITGAIDGVTVNNRKLDHWQSLHCISGDRIKINAPKRGRFIYLSINGGFATSMAYASCASSPRDHLPLREILGISSGQVLQRNATENRLATNRIVPEEYQAEFSGPFYLDFIPNPEYEKSELVSLELDEFSVQAKSDKMAVRLKGHEQRESNAKSRWSSPTPAGSIQSLPNGELSILMQDGQTIGGYPVAGTLTQISVAKLSQAQPQVGVSLSPICSKKALAQWQSFLNFFAAV